MTVKSSAIAVSRRSMLMIPLALGGAKAQARRLKVVVTGGHPGDPECGCGGTVARYTAEGHDVTLLYLNRGQRGCGPVAPAACGGTRTAEAEKACRILKAHPKFDAQSDGEAVVDNAHYGEFRKILEQEAPDVVFTHWPLDNHRDHRAAWALSFDAWNAMGRKFALYYYEVSDGEDTTPFPAREYVDISGTERIKREACFAHVSQNPAKFYTLQERVTSFRGIESGFAQAEAFVRQAGSRGGVLPQ